MTNWFIQDGKVLTVDGKIRGCCCEETADCSISYHVSPYLVYYIDPFTKVKSSGDYVPTDGTYFITPANVVHEYNTTDPTFTGTIMIRCDGGVPHVWLWINGVYTTDLGEAPATGSLQYQFASGGNTITITVTAL